MVQVAALLSKDSYVVTCGSYSWVDFKGKRTKEHDSKSVFTPPDHTEQHPEVVPQLTPLGSGAAQSRFVLCCQGSSLCFGCSVGFSIDSSVLCFCTAAIALDVLFATDTWNSGSIPWEYSCWLVKLCHFWLKQRMSAHWQRAHWCLYPL